MKVGSKKIKYRPILYSDVTATGNAKFLLGGVIRHEYSLQNTYEEAKNLAVTGMEINQKAGRKVKEYVIEEVIISKEEEMNVIERKEAVSAISGRLKRLETLLEACKVLGFTESVIRLEKEVLRTNAAFLERS